MLKWILQTIESPLCLLIIVIGRSRLPAATEIQRSGSIQEQRRSAELHFCEKRQSDTKEAHRAYAVDKAVIEEAYALITKNRVSTWSKKKILGNVGAVTGAVNILKFRN